MISSVLEFMRGSGLNESRIRDAFEKGLSKLRNGRRDRMARGVNDLRVGNENLSAELLRVWHRDGRYIDEDARPRPLSLNSGRNSLHAIVSRIDPKANATGILKEMKAVKLIRRTATGRYLPTSEAAIVGTLHPLATDHVAKLVVRLVSTVSRNVDQSRSSLPLIERHAYVPDLNRTERRAFADFTRSQGMAYLESVDNWLEQRRVRRVQSGTRRNVEGVPASVHLFAYLGDGRVKSATTGEANSLRQTKRSGETKSVSSSRSKRLAPLREAPA